MLVVVAGNSCVCACNPSPTVQGVGGNANCLNVTLPNGTVVLEKEKLSPRFSVEVSRSFLQCCGSGTAWIRIGFGRIYPDPRGQKMAHKNRNSEDILCLEGLDVLF